MDGYPPNNNYGNNWNAGYPQTYPNQVYDQDYSNLQNQQLDFQTFDVGDYEPTATQDSSQYSNYKPTSNQQPYYNPIPDVLPNQQYYPNIFTPGPPPEEKVPDEFDEPPLLEELEIYPDRILAKTLAVLNPFHSHGLVDDVNYLTKDTDLAGPITFCLALAVCLFLSGSHAHFGYIYGLSMISCILMYCLLTLMSPTSGVFTFMGVASILGYCLLPIVALSFLGIFVSLHGTAGLVLASVAVFWSSLSASRLFVSISGDFSQRPLIAYPCALVNGVFALLIVF